MKKKRNRSEKSLSESAVPSFSYSWLMPQYWLPWLAIGLLSMYQFLPILLRQKISIFLGKRYYKKNKKRRHIALTNLKMCFPDWSEKKRQEFLKKHFAASIHVMLDLPLLWWSGKSRLEKKIKTEGLDELLKIRRQGTNVVLLTCHNVALEYGAIGLNFKMPIVGLVNPFRNPLVDWLISRARTRFDIRLAVRKDGIRPIVQAIKQGDVFYYLPDEDALDQQTIEASFFGQPKQSLPTLAKLARVSKSKVVPCYSWYDFEQHCYRVRCLPEMEINPKDSETLTTQQMNQKLEELIMIQPEQYMWTMRLFESYAAYV